MVTYCFFKLVNKAYFKNASSSLPTLPKFYGQSKLQRQESTLHNHFQTPLPRSERGTSKANRSSKQEINLQLNGRTPRDAPSVALATISFYYSLFPSAFQSKEMLEEVNRSLMKTLLPELIPVHKVIWRPHVALSHGL